MDNLKRILYLYFSDIMDKPKDMLNLVLVACCIVIVIIVNMPDARGNRYIARGPVVMPDDVPKKKIFASTGSTKPVNHSARDVGQTSEALRKNEKYAQPDLVTSTVSCSSCRQCLNEYIAQTSDVFRKNEGYSTEVIEEINVLDNYNQDFPALFTSTVKKNPIPNPRVADFPIVRKRHSIDTNLKPKTSIPNSTEWGIIFAQVFDELKSRKIKDDAHYMFTAKDPLRYNRKGEGSYKCENCGRWWSSVNALAEFEYRLSKKRKINIGDVLIVLSGQSCKKGTCNKSKFIKPEFSVDAIQCILEMLLNKVKQKVYEVQDTNEVIQRDYIPPQGNGFHDPEYCEACKKGICKFNLDDPKKNFAKRTSRTRDDTGMMTIRPDISVKWYLRFE